MEKKHAGFWIRFFAYFIDSAILFAGGFILGMVAGDVSLLASLLSLAYFIVLPVTSLQGTLGKSLLGLKITNISGEKISIGQSIGRYFAYILSGLILFIGFIMIGARADKKGLHDLICKTQVVYKN